MCNMDLRKPRKAGYDENIVIAPETNTIFVSNKEFSYQEDYSQFINLDLLKVDGVAAIQIAEQSGGTSARLIYKNNCGIGALLAPDGEAKNWIINYSNIENVHIYDVTIDKITGTIKLIH